MASLIASVDRNTKKVKSLLDEYLEYVSEKKIWSHRDNNNHKDLMIIIRDSAKNTWRKETHLEIEYDEKYSFGEKFRQNMKYDTLKGLLYTLKSH